MKTTKLLCVSTLEAKPNKMFSEEQRGLVRFLQFNQPVACAACGKKSKSMWTHLTEFKAGDMDGSFGELRYFPKVFQPLTPVCDDHPLGLADKRKTVQVLLRSYAPGKVSPQLEQWTQPLCYSHPVKCGACGKKGRDHWTMFCEFTADKSGTLPPLTPVCFKHSVMPAIQ